MDVADNVDDDVVVEGGRAKIGVEALMAEAAALMDSFRTMTKPEACWVSKGPAKAVEIEEDKEPGRPAQVFSRPLK